jgi:hypothetical protein
MSRNEWEGGTLLLPSAAGPALRLALRQAANAHHDRVLAECRRLWLGPIAQTRSTKLYRQRLEAALMASRWSDDAQYALGLAMYHVINTWPGQAASAKDARPRMPRAADVEPFAPRATVRSVTFEAQEWRIAIDGHKLTYDSGEGNYRIERARAHPVVAALFAALKRVTWTRDSGGVFTGNDESNRDARGVGGGGNYITMAYGPRGEDERAYAMGMSPAQYRRLMNKPPTRSSSSYYR